MFPGYTHSLFVSAQKACSHQKNKMKLYKADIAIYIVKALIFQKFHSSRIK